MLPVNRAAGHAITTLEGLGTPEKPDPVQAAFIAEQAAQCGYCTNGMIMAAEGAAVADAAADDRSSQSTPWQATSVGAERIPASCAPSCARRRCSAWTR